MVLGPICWLLRPLVQVFKAGRSLTSQSILPTRRAVSSSRQVKGAHLTMTKINTAHFGQICTPELNCLQEIFDSHNHELRIAGGAVRDILMGISPDDIDFATTATPDEMKGMFEKLQIRMINTTGEKHGTITCRINDKKNFEITTLRVDLRTDGRHAEVQFTTDWMLDAARRDLTVNSLFLGLDGTIYDYFGGIKDIENRVVRFVGNADARITEDYLRILRYFRFFGRLTNDPEKFDEEAISAILTHKDGLKGISGERIWMELRKILLGKHVASIVRKMISLGLAEYMGLPASSCTEKLCELVRWSDENHLHLEPMTLLAALLTCEDELLELRSRLKISNADLEIASFVICHRADHYRSKGIKHFQHLFFAVPNNGRPLERLKISELLKYLQDRTLLDEFSQWEAPTFPIGGQHLIEQGLVTRKKFAYVLSRLKSLWEESDYRLGRNELLERVKDIMEEDAPETSRSNSVGISDFARGKKRRKRKK